MMHKEYVPYTYLIGWSKYKVWYYGSRFANYANTDRGTANPNELWITYFTSSKHVKEFRQEHGEPDIIQIRKRFKNKELVRVWEHKVLRRMDVMHRSDFLNKSNAISIPSQKGIKKPAGFADKISKIHKGKIVSAETRKKMSLVAKNRPRRSDDVIQRQTAAMLAVPRWNKGLKGYKRGPYKKKPKDNGDIL